MASSTSWLVCFNSYIHLEGAYDNNSDKNKRTCLPRYSKSSKPNFNASQQNAKFLGPFKGSVAMFHVIKNNNN